MKKISILSVAAVLIVATCGESMAASSLVTSANSANMGAISRASSLRLNSVGRAASLGPKSKTTKSLAPNATEKKNNASKTRSASISRGSVGRYIGAASEQTVSMDALPSPLFERIGTIENNVQNLTETKQDKVTDAVADNIAIWDDAGQTSDSGRSITEDAVSDTSTHDTIPTSQAVYEYVNGQGYVTAETATEILTPVMETMITDAMVDYSTTAEINTLLEGYVTNEALENTLSGYATTGALSDVQSIAEAAQDTANETATYVETATATATAAATAAQAAADAATAAQTAATNAQSEAETAAASVASAAHDASEASTAAQEAASNAALAAQDASDALTTAQAAEAAVASKQNSHITDDPSQYGKILYVDENGNIAISTVDISSI